MWTFSVHLYRLYIRTFFVYLNIFISCSSERVMKLYIVLSFSLSFLLLDHFKSLNLLPVKFEHFNRQTVSCVTLNISIPLIDNSLVSKMICSVVTLITTYLSPLIRMRFQIRILYTLKKPEVYMIIPKVRYLYVSQALAIFISNIRINFPCSIHYIILPHTAKEF